MLNNEGLKVLFVSGIIQKAVKKNVEELKKHEDYDMVIIPSFWEGVQTSPRIHEVKKIYMNNTLGFSIFCMCRTEQAYRKNKWKMRLIISAILLLLILDSDFISDS